MNHLDHLQYLADKFEIQKYLAFKRSHGTIEQDALELSRMFGRSYQTCKKIVKHCVRMQWWKPADPIGNAIKDLWTIRKKTTMPLLRMRAYDRRFHQQVSLVKPLIINGNGYTYYITDWKIPNIAG